MSISCPECAASMPDTAAFCPGCGRAMQPAIQPVERVQGNVGGLPQTVAGALAYCTIVPAIVFLLVEPYSKNRFVRFHSFQCIGLWLAALVFGAALRVAGVLLFFVPLLGHLVVLLLSMVVSLGFFVIWVVMIVKALQGEMLKLPVIGDFAQQQIAEI
ncbi:MAG: zinc-ribbon domain-containing protein [Candidatus Sulfotelmatobacter sp.]